MVQLLVAAMEACQGALYEPPVDPKTLLGKGKPGAKGAKEPAKPAAKPAEAAKGKGKGKGDEGPKTLQVGRDLCPSCGIVCI